MLIIFLLTLKYTEPQLFELPKDPAPLVMPYDADAEELEAESTSTNQ